MYLEISARRTGKTRRLAEAVKKHLKDGGEAIVVAPWLQRCDSMDLPRKEPNLFILSDWHLKTCPPEKLKAIKLDNPRWFFDEFDFFENLRPHIAEGGYYVTTPRFTRKIWEMTEDQIKADVLLSLLKLNKGQYAAHTWDFWDSESLLGMGSALSGMTRKTEILGQFASEEKGAGPKRIQPRLIQKVIAPFYSMGFMVDK